jgi:hypothetical protein
LLEISDVPFADAATLMSAGQIESRDAFEECALHACLHVAVGDVGGDRHVGAAILARDERRRRT